MDEIQLLKNRILELEKWKEERIRQQINFPLDKESIGILEEFFMHITNIIEYDAGAGSNHFKHYLGKQGSKRVPSSSYVPSSLEGIINFQIEPVSLVGYTVDPATDFLTTTQSSGNLKFFDGTAVTLTTEGTAPAPLDGTLGTVYYVRDSDGYKFKLAATLGGAAINITTRGAGRQFIVAS